MKTERPKANRELSKPSRSLILPGSLFVVGGAFFLLSGSGKILAPLALVSALALPGLVLAVVYGYLWKWQGREIRSPHCLPILVSIMLIGLALCRFSLWLGSSVQTNFHAPHLVSIVEYAVPVSFIALMLSAVFDSGVAFAGSLGAIVLLSFLSSQPFDFFLISLCGSLVGILALGKAEERTSFLKAGGLIGLSNMGTILILSLFHQRIDSLAYGLLGGAISGPLAGILGLGLLPMLEDFLDLSTNFRLLELANPQQPILRELILLAPGTYHHSMVVGTLGEAAAEAIGANPFLVRASAYYHDIGKIRKPEYFIENQIGTANPHAKLSASMSSLILISHVKEGVELAKEKHLPLSIIEVIKQHHGTCLITYFYQKAKEAENPELAEVREEDYRYPGPKPQTKEAAIVMLADAVEAASKTLSDPTPARIQGMVQRMINSIFVDGQLEECDLTLKDLHQIAQSFVRILSGIYHHRVHYPGFDFEGEGQENRGGHGDSGQKLPTKDKSRLRSSPRGYPKDIRKLGS